MAFGFGGPAGSLNSLFGGIFRPNSPLLGWIGRRGIPWEAEESSNGNIMCHAQCPNAHEIPSIHVKASNSDQEEDPEDSKNDRGGARPAVCMLDCSSKIVKMQA